MIAATSTTAASATTAANDPRHPTACPSSVPSGRPRALAVANPEITRAIARPRARAARWMWPSTIAAAMYSPCTAPMTTRATRNAG